MTRIHSTSPDRSRSARRIDPLQPLAATAAIIGMGILLAGPQGMRVLGMPIDSRAAWGLRMFGVRELVLGLGLARASQGKSREQAVLMADLVAAAQAGDMLLSAVLLIRRKLSRRAAVVVWLGALPTLLATRAARNFSRDR